LNKFFKAYGILLTGLLALMALAAPANAARYSIANYFPLPNAATNDERVYQDDQGSIQFERSGGVMAARTAPGLSNGPTVPASVIQSSDGSYDLFTMSATGLTHHGNFFNNPVQHSHDKTYEYDFITAPATPAALAPSDFLPANLTTPSPMLPAIVDTAVKKVFHHNFARVNEYVDVVGYKAQQSIYVQETVTVDDNGGLLFDLTNPANPDYDPAFVAMWQTANRGSGIAHLKRLLKVTIKDVSTGIGGVPTWFGNSTTVIYFASGIGVVYWNESGFNGTIQKLLSYKVGANTGAVGGLKSQLVKVQNPAGAALAASSVSLSGPMVWDPLAINPTTRQPTGANVPSYTSDVFVEQTPRSGIFKLYYMQGDLVDLTLRGTGYADQTATAQNLTTKGAASAPNPVPYTLTTLLGTISGKMLDAAGNPVANVKVFLNPQVAFTGFGRNWTPPVVVTTDVNGNYTAQVDPGVFYTVAAGIDGSIFFHGLPALPVGSLGGQVTQTGQVRTSQLGQIGSFSAASGATVVVNIRLAAGAVVSGKLTDVTGAPYANANINLQSGSLGGSPYPAFAVTDVNGNYSITAAPGSYTVNITPNWNNATGQPRPFPAGMLGGYVGTTGLLVPQINAAKTYGLSVATPTTINMRLVAGAVVSGVLTDANGAGYANARIQLNDPVSGGFGFTTTDATGHYSVTVAPGSYTIQVSPGWGPVTGTNQFPNGMAGGYVSMTGALVSNPAQARQFNLQVGTPTIVSMQLLAGATVSGVLRDVNGVPYANATVTLDAAAGVGFGQTASYSTTTAANGSYSITVAPGSYTITVKEGIDPVSNQPVPFPTGMMGGRVDVTGALTWNTPAVTFTLTSGMATTVNMKLSSGAVISGVLTDTAGAPYVNAMINLNDNVAIQSGYGQTDAAGHYSITVVPGNHYTVSVVEGFDFATRQPVPFPAGTMGGYVGAAGGLTPQAGAAKIYAFTAATPTLINMQLITGAVVSGVLTDATGAVYAGAQIQLNDPVAGVKGFTATDASGRYSLTVAPGSYTIQVLPGFSQSTRQQGQFPNGMTGGYVDVNGVLVGNAAQARQFNVQLAAPTVVNMKLIPGATVSGTLLDANATAYANAQVLLSDATGNSFAMNTDAAGKYAFTVTPGTYTISVLPGFNNTTGQPGAFLFPAGMMGGVVNSAGVLDANPNAVAKQYNLLAGSTTVVSLQLIAGATVSGTLTDANGAPYANAAIAIEPSAAGPAGSAGPLSVVMTDVNGHYSFLVAAGGYVINVTPGVDPVTGQPVPLPVGMSGGFVSAANGLVAQRSGAKVFTLTAGAAITVNMQLAGLQPATAVNKILLALSLGDVNGNGKGDIAVLGKRRDTGKYVVRVKDPVTVPHLVREIALNGAYMPVQMVKLADMNRNGSPEIAVLEVDPATGKNGQIQVKDSRTGALITNIRIKSTVKPHMLVALPDVNGNTFADLALSEVDPVTGKNVQIQVKDGKTGAKIANIRVSQSVKPHQLVALASVNGAPALALSEVDAVTGKNVQIQVKRASNGALIKNIRVNTSSKPHQLVAMGDVNGNGSADIALSEVNATTGKNVQIQVKDGSTGTKIRNIAVNPNYKPHELVVLADVNGNGSSDIALSEVNATTGKSVQIQVKDGRSGAKISNIHVKGTTKPYQLLSLGNINGVGSPADLALLEVNPTTGKNVQIQVKDPKTGAKIRNILLNPNYFPLGMGSTLDINGNGVQELGVLEMDATGKVQVQVKDTLTGGLIRNQPFPHF